MFFGPLQQSTTQDHRFPRIRLAVISTFMLIFLGISLARLVELTAIHGAENLIRANENRILIRPIRAPRGVILDHRQKALTRNIPSVRLTDLPGDNLGPVPIEEATRSYPLNSVLAHVIGYVGEVSREELDNCRREKDCRLSPGDIIGKTGLEKEYDYLLRGIDGAQLVEVDANGRVIRIVGEQMPIPGSDLAVNLDASLGQSMTAALAGFHGAAVAVNPADGSVLGLVSSPGYDPNLFSPANEAEIDNSAVTQLLEDTQNLPLFNRAVSGEYPPGSIFKLVTAMAGLASEKISSATTIEDTGEIRIDSFRYGNWYFDQYGKTEGNLGLVRAIARSNDIFFYRVGEMVGPELMADWAAGVGLGSKLKIDLPVEADGLVPSPEWKERQIGERWFLGNTYHFAIGQGDIRVTPLQVAVMTAAVITGNKCRPLISNLKIPGQNSPDCSDLGISQPDRQLILDGMIQACSPGGTAFPFFPWNAQDPSFPEAKAGPFPVVACKTGTAQHGGEKTLPHAWITVAGPIIDGKLDIKSPKSIVLTVLLESAGEGSYQAGPVAKQILSDWFQNNQ